MVRKSAKRFSGNDHAQTMNQGAMTIPPNLIALLDIEEVVNVCLAT
jgi:hypothetical protein